MAVHTDPITGLSRSLRIAVLAFLAALCGTVSTAHSQTRSAIAHRLKSPSNVDWPVYGGQAAGDHYSSLSQINRKNVHELQLAWKFDAEEEGGPETSPIIVFAPVTNFLYGLDARTGKPMPNFGEGGRIDLRKDLRGDYQAQSVAMTSPGMVYKDLNYCGRAQSRNPSFTAWRHSSVRCAHRRTALEISHHSPPRRVWI
jgi:quinoprotein glucose dehydrogenase